jgi:hypothetical protein
MKLSSSSPGARRALAALLLLTAAVASPPARADNLTDLTGQLERGGDYKVRLSAAISLTKLGDQRAISSLVGALKDPDRNVRGAAAVGLGKLINARTKDAVREQVVSALKATVAEDSNPFVRSQAQKTLDALSPAGLSSIFVEIGPMTDKTGDAGRLDELMRKTARETIAKKARDMMLEWPGGKPPKAAELKSKGVSGFYVDGTLVTLTTKEKGASTLVSCKISMLLAKYPEKDMFGFLDGSASVQASSSAQDIAYAKEDCVLALVEDLVGKKIVSTIRDRGSR